MLREISDKTWLWPIRARYMHDKEIDRYESQIQTHAFA